MKALELILALAAAVLSALSAWLYAVDKPKAAGITGSLAAAEDALMPRPKATLEQAERRRLRRAWASRTEIKALRALRRKHPGEFLVILDGIRQGDPEPGKADGT